MTLRLAEGRLTSLSPYPGTEAHSLGETRTRHEPHALPRMSGTIRQPGPGRRGVGLMPPRARSGRSIRADNRRRCTGSARCILRTRILPAGSPLRGCSRGQIL